MNWSFHKAVVFRRGPPLPVFPPEMELRLWRTINHRITEWLALEAVTKIIFLF